MKQHLSLVKSWSIATMHNRLCRAKQIYQLIEKQPICWFAVHEDACKGHADVGAGRRLPHEGHVLAAELEGEVGVGVPKSHTRRQEHTMQVKAHMYNHMTICRTEARG